VGPQLAVRCGVNGVHQDPVAVAVEAGGGVLISGDEGDLSR